MQIIRINQVLILALLIMIPIRILGNGHSASFIEHSSTYKIAPDSGENCLSLTLSILNKRLQLYDAKVVVYEDNTIIKTIAHSTFTENFIFKRDKYYSIEIRKAGFYPKLVSINTTLPAELVVPRAGLFEFKLDLQLMKESPNAKPSEYLDFPVAVISYNQKKNNFYYNKNYTKYIKNKIKEDSKPKSKK